MNLIQNHPFLHGMAAKHIDLIGKGAELAAYRVNDLLISEGEPASQFFLIESGSVALETGAPGKAAPILTIGTGEPLGWSWLFPPFLWHFSGRALEPTQAIILNAGHLLVLCEENNALGYDLMRRIAQIAITRMEATCKKLVD
jgi:CRP/FNR family cyclic AMP-dependent transcriptional regulator